MEVEAEGGRWREEWEGGRWREEWEGGGSGGREVVGVEAEGGVGGREGGGS